MREILLASFNLYMHRLTLHTPSCTACHCCQERLYSSGSHLSPDVALAAARLTSSPGHGYDPGSLSLWARVREQGAIYRAIAPTVARPARLRSLCRCGVGDKGETMA